MNVRSQVKPLLHLIMVPNQNNLEK
uniref:Uncharacterized protein n=1 Tax=Anguilla anguilla TaxID=7936 RepID=A0A0E9W2M1_ANGAN